MSMFEDIGRAWDDVRFWQQIKGDAKRTVVVHPDHVDYLRAAVRVNGLDDIVTVVGNPVLTIDQGFVIDTPAMDAYERQNAQAWKPTLWPYP